MSSYKVLARKWRPQHFRDMIGQEPVLRALINALDTDRLHHAYLFTGMRGVGKTTIARIFAKCLNCLENGVGSSPCGECTACRDIEAGRFLDLIEVDAASRTKVDETRELLENVPYAPASGRYKVYLIDEVHMFSTHSFNALLKTLEEPPEHVKFLLATTDPQKVPLTVLSRCLQFNLRRMPGAKLADYLGSILDAEAIPHERAALELVADAAEGSVRDSLSLVEQAAALGEGAIREAEVASMLGRVSAARLLELLDALGEGDLGALFERVDALAEYAPDFGQLLGELLSLLHRVAMAQSLPGGERSEASGAERVAALAERLAPDEVQLWYQIGLHARRDLPFAPDPREAFDMALLRMRAFAPDAALANAAPASSRPATSAVASASSAASEVPADGAPARGGPVGAAGASPASNGGVPAAGAGSTPTHPAADPRAAVLAAAGVVTDSSPSRPPAATPAAAPEAAPATAPVGADAGPASTAAGDGSASARAAPSVPAPAVAATPPPAPASPPEAVRPVPEPPEPVGDPPLAAEAAASAGAVPPSAPIAPPSAPSAAAVPPSPAPAVGVPAGGLAALTPDNWPAVIEAAKLTGMPRQLAAHCALVSCEGGALVLQLESGAEHMNSPRFAERLRTALVAWAGAELALDVRVVDGALETPSRIAAAREENALADARRAIDEDPIAQALVSGVDGTLDPASVRPLGPAPDPSPDP